MLSSHPKKQFHHKNGSDELDVFQAANYFSSATENFSGIHRNLKPIRRTSLDMRTEKGNFIPSRSMMTETPAMISGEKKFKKPSSPGAKLAHFLNSLFNQTSLKKSKKKSTNDDEDESPSGWRRKRRSSISHFSSGNSHSSSSATTTTATITTAGCGTPPPSTKTTSYIDLRSYSNLKPPPTQITKIPFTENLNKIKNFNVKSDFPEQNMSFRHGFVEKVKTSDEKQEDHDHPYKYVSREDMKEFKKFADDDDGDSDSSSDLFELTNCDLGCYSSGLPVYETTRMDSIKRASPISNKV